MKLIILPFFFLWRKKKLRYLQNVRLEGDSPGRPPLEIDPDGTLRSVELKIVNLQPDDTGHGGEWKKVFSTRWH